MRNVKIVADSSANLLNLKNTPFAAAPLKIIANDREFVDDAALDVDGMVKWFDSYKGKSKTSCPNPSDWLEAFGDADEVYCVTITSGLSGSYNAACIAKQMYEEKNSSKRVCVIDSLSAGPELVLIVEKLEEYIRQELSYEEICDMDFRVVFPANCYAYDEATETYTDLRETQAGLKYLYDNGTDLKVSGIIRPKEDAVASMITGHHNR